MVRTKSGTNIGGAGEHNRRVIMHGLRVNGTMSRAQIARATGLVPQTVSNIMDELLCEGLVLAAAPVRAGRGQPATPYSINPHGAFSYGMQIDQHRARVVAVDLLGRVITGVDASFHPGGLESNLPTVLTAFTQVSQALAARVAPASPRILGLGLAMPAPTGVHDAGGDPWMTGLNDTHPMVQALYQATGLPVGLHHDASAAAIAERLTGAAVGMDDFVLFFIGYGLGAGIYANGEPYRGHHRLAGEIGQVTVPIADGPVPLEHLTSLSALYRLLGLQPNQPDIYQELERAIAGQNPAVDQWITTAARHLVWAFGLVECLLDPESVVISGQMPEPLMQRLMSAIRAAQGAGPAEASASRPQLVQGSTGVFSVAAGAAADPIARAFDPSFSAMMKSLA